MTLGMLKEIVDAMVMEVGEDSKLWVQEINPIEVRVHGFMKVREMESTREYLGAGQVFTFPLGYKK